MIDTVPRGSANRAIGGCVALALLLVATQAPGADAEHATTSDRARLEGCQDSYAPISASAAQVRRHVPDSDQSRYRILGEQLGAAILVVRVFACDSVKVPGSRPRPTLGAQFGVTLESPDGTGRAFGSDACCNWYTFFWVTDNRPFAKWLKQGTGLRGVVRYVKGLTYRHEPILGSGMAAIHFAARRPTPSPFQMEATAVTPDRWPGIEISPNWWAQTQKGSVRIANHVPGFQGYPASGEIRTQPGTRMAALFEAERRLFGSPFSYGRWDQSFTMKGVLRPGTR